MLQGSSSVNWEIYQIDHTIHGRKKEIDYKSGIRGLEHKTQQNNREKPMKTKAGSL